ncbi:MAG: DinB family protein [Gemmatimonadaceae bacterium]
MASGKPVWLDGPIAGVPALLQPVAHALLEAAEDVQAVLPTLSVEALWARPANVASVGFHVKHAMGSLDRLFTYARGESLSGPQLATLAAEKTLDGTAGTGGGQLAAEFAAAVDRAIEQLKATSEHELLEPREVGRAKLPSNVLGLLAHAGDHTYRHVGQLITTAKLALGRQGT